jgi:glycosyltransferase involved in cell wall biosynthesis
MTEGAIDYSIVIPVYYNEGSLKPIFEEIKNKVIDKNPERACEVIFVDDGSKDNSFSELLEIKSHYPEIVKIIKLVRNFGQLQAIMAGYTYARGKCVVTISADLQDPPELINTMLDHHFKSNYQIVICTRESRDESFFRRSTSYLFYSIIRFLSFSNMPQKGFDYVLLSDKVKNIILDNQEANAFFQGQILWTGFDIKFIPYSREKRQQGISRWTFSKKIKYLIDGVLSYSYFPLRAMSVVGFIVALLGFTYAMVIFFSKIFGSIPVQGWAPIMIVILVLSGIQMLMLGIIGEYLWRALDQVRNRKPYIIERILD